MEHFGATSSTTYCMQSPSKMAGEDLLFSVCALVIAIIMKRRRKRRRKRKIWTRDWVRNRQKYGAYHQLLQELRISDSTSYRNFLRMDIATFEELLQITAPAITYQDTNKREAIPPGERLAVTLRFLATGKYIQCHAYNDVKIVFCHCRGNLHKFAVCLQNSSSNNWKNCPRNMRSNH